MPTLTGPEAVLEAVGDSVVRVRSTYGTNSGVIFENFNGNSAYVLTSQHITGRALGVVNVTTRSGQDYVGTVVGRDSTVGLAVVRICCSDEFTTLPFASASPSPGDAVYIVGYPLGEMNPTVTQRAVTFLVDNGVEGRVEVRLNGGMNAGTGGGPMVDATGRLAGLTTYRARRSSSAISVEDYGFGLSVETIRDHLADLKSGQTHVVVAPAPAPSVHGGTFDSPIFGYEIDVPQGWIIDPGNVLRVALWNPHFGNVVFVQGTGVDESYSDVEDLIEDHPFTGHAEWGTITVVSDDEIMREYADSTETTVGHEFVFRFTWQDVEWAGTVHWMLSNTAGSNNLYEVFAVAPSSIIEGSEYADVERQMRLVHTSFGPPVPY